MEEKSKEMEKEIIKFLSEFCSVKENKLDISTEIGRDLGVDGDDGVDLLEGFSKKFRVDLAGLDINEYFGPEAGFSPFPYIANIFPKKKTKLKPIKVVDLVRAAKTGKW